MLLVSVQFSNASIIFAVIFLLKGRKNKLNLGYIKDVEKGSDACKIWFRGRQSILSTQRGRGSRAEIISPIDIARAVRK